MLQFNQRFCKRQAYSRTLTGLIDFIKPLEYLFKLILWNLDAVIIDGKLGIPLAVPVVIEVCLI